MLSRVIVQDLEKLFSGKLLAERLEEYILC